MHASVKCVRVCENAFGGGFRNDIDQIVEEFTGVTLYVSPFEVGKLADYLLETDDLVAQERVR